MNLIRRDPGRRPRPRPALWLALGALVLAQWLGLVHTVLHAGPGGTAHAGAEFSGHGRAPALADGLASLWSHDGLAPECRLFDPIVAADVPPVAIAARADFTAFDLPVPPAGIAPAPQRHERPPARAPPQSA